MRVERRHEKEVIALRVQLERIAAISQSFNQVRMIQVTAQAEGLVP